ncbi:cation diffusion facilitator family transporter [Coxiella-like endosymbiont]|uniref:cation diffusion facilitator family transporter n=1 Tax=Coxiella-like endosymbiont TaxID=1592897 RepID=UPI00272A1BFC|nr:cation diffusion facilitator family transporter [Coxiella-like endosymbiont]
MIFSKSKNRHLSTLLSVSLISAFVNTLLALFKIGVGIICYSQALIADGIHSLSDLLTDGLVVIAGHLGAQSPDKEHPYGHGRIETIGAIIISLILIFVALGIITFDTLHHIIHRVHSTTPTFSVIVVGIVSVIANESLFRYTLIKGNKINSDLLRTNAWHNRSDALVSLIVLASVIGTRLGITYLDSIGALIIALLILRMGLKMIWKNIQELIDAAVDDETLEKITNIISTVPGVLSIHQLRTRSHGGNIFIDVHIQVTSNISVSEGHYISEQVHVNLMKNISHVADVTMHIDPENDATSTPLVNLPNREDIHRLLKVHCQNLPSFKEIRRTILHYLDSKVYIEIYLPLTAVKDQKEQLELQYQDIISRVKYIAKVSLYFE